jgi:hypothetical protein
VGVVVADGKADAEDFLVEPRGDARFGWNPAFWAGSIRGRRRILGPSRRSIRRGWRWGSRVRRRW